jgi:hypothetical protein
MRKQNLSAQYVIYQWVKQVTQCLVATEYNGINATTVVKPP